MWCRTKAEKGSVVLEAGLVMPLLLISILAAGQFAHINLVKQLGAVAAYNGCRAAIRSGAPEEAVNKVLSSKLLLDNSITVTKSERGPDGSYHLALEYKLPLIFPVVNYVICGIMGYSSDGFHANGTGGNGDLFTSDSSPYPCITLKAASVLPMPYGLSNEKVL